MLFNVVDGVSLIELTSYDGEPSKLWRFSIVQVTKILNIK